MSDVHEFLNAYQETLDHKVETSDWPPEIASIYSFESCLKYSEGKEVYLVVDKRTGGKAILRVTSHDSGERAEAEWAILSRLDHPGIPKTYGILITDSKSYIVREFIPGQPIDIVVAQRYLSPQDVFSFARKLCDILSYLHHQMPPIIHRDIKPQNIILKPDGSIVLTDFGIARIFKPGADSDTRYAGTLPYAPPEQYGYAQSTPQTDIYALGIVLVYLSTGSPNRQNLQDKIKNKKLLTLINRCIAFSPSDRFTSVDEVKRFIDSKGRKRAKIAIGIASGLVVLTLVGVGVFVLFDSLGKITGQSGQSTEASNSSPSSSSNIKGTSTPVSTEGPLFDSTVAGNLTGNIGNGGFAVEGEDEIYVAFEKGIYVLEQDGSLGRMAVDVRGASSLNYYQGKLYFSGNYGLLCADPQTGKLSTIVDVYVGNVFIDDGVLYYEDAEDFLKLYTVEFDGTNIRKVNDHDSVYYRNVVGGHEYFTNLDDYEALYRMNLETGEEEQLYDIRSAWISVYDTTIYFSDFSIPGRLLCMDLDGGNIQELLIGSYSYVNATPLGVFFTNPEGEQLECMALDGKSRTLLTDKSCGAFCITRNWVLYKNKTDGGNLWMMRTDGSDDQPFPLA